MSNETFTSNGENPDENKLETARLWLKWMADHYTAPVLLVSFGKDSMVMLHLARTMGYNWPVVTFMDPWWPERYRYAQRLIQEWNLEVHVPPAKGLGMYEQDGDLQAVTSYGLGGGDIALPRDVLRYNEHEALGNEICLKEDFFRRPTGTMTFPWDVAGHGQKASDTNPIFGKVGVNTHQLKTPSNSPDLIYPLKDWTDDDIWDYAAEHEIPLHEERYDVENRTVWKDRKDDIDYVPACARCVDRSEADSVWCPKHQKITDNISKNIPYVENLQLAHHECENPPATES